MSFSSMFHVFCLILFLCGYSICNSCSIHCIHDVSLFFMNLFRVRLYVNVPGSLIIAGNSKKPIRKPPSSTKIEEPSMEVKAIPETEADSGNMTRSGAMSM